MKKLIVILVLLLIPLNVFALSITDVNINGSYKEQIGKEFTLDYNIMFDEIKRNDPNSYGLILVGMELEIDTDVFQIDKIESPIHTEYVIDTNNKNKIYIISVIDDETNYITCSDNVTYCDNYKATITFGIKNTDKDSGNIKMISAYAMAVKISEETDDEFKIYEIKKDVNKTNPIMIGKNTEPYQELKSLEPSTNKDMDAKNILNDVKNDKKDDKVLSSNNFIKSLSIENYDIDFDKYKTDYNLDLKNEDNSLKINVELDNSFAKYKIIGNDDLKSNNYKVLIEVTAQNGEIETYTINMLKKSTSEITTTKKVKIESKFKFDKKYILYFVIGISIFIIIIIIVIINYIINKKKVDNLFKK